AHQNTSAADARQTFHRLYRLSGRASAIRQALARLLAQEGSGARRARRQLCGKTFRGGVSVGPLATGTEAVASGTTLRGRAREPCLWASTALRTGGRAWRRTHSSASSRTRSNTRC